MTFALNLKCFNHVTNPRYVYDAIQRAMVVLATEAHLQYLRRIKDTPSFPAIHSNKSKQPVFLSTNLGEHSYGVTIYFPETFPENSEVRITADETAVGQFMLRYIGANLLKLGVVSAVDMASGRTLKDFCAPGTFNIGDIRPALQDVMYPDPLSKHPKFFLLNLGYDVDIDDDQPGTWIWTSNADGCTQSYETPADALEAAWAHAAYLAMLQFETTEKGFSQMSFRDQVELIKQTLS